MAVEKLAEKTSPVIAPENGRKRKIRTMVQTPWGPQMAKQTFRQAYYIYIITTVEKQW